MGERVSHLFQHTTEDTASTDSGDYTTASDEDTVSGSNDESCADSVDSGGTDYATADEDIASDSSPGTSEGNVLLATEHSATISPGIAITSPTHSHMNQPPSSLSSSQAQEAQPPSHRLQASSLLLSQEQPQDIPASQALEAQLPSHQFQVASLSVSQSLPFLSPSQTQLPSNKLIPSSQVQPVAIGSYESSFSSRAEEAQDTSHQPSQAQPSLQSSSKQYLAGEGTPSDSPEGRALGQHSAKLFKAISASDQLDLSWLLFANDLIGQETLDYCQLEVTQTKKSSKIVSAVIKTVSASPHLFESLVSVLSDSGNDALMSVGEKLKQTHELTSKEKLTDSLSLSKAHKVQLPPSSQPQSPELCLYAKYLRAVYTRSKLPIYSKWPPSPGKRFINLAIISKEGITKEKADEFTKATLHGDLEEILKSKAPVKFEEILKAKPDEKLKCVLIEGAPGVGKTTLSWEVCHRWGKGELYQEYSTVVLLRLRDQTVQRAVRVTDLFYYPDEDTQKQIAKDIVNSQGSGMLIILEGLDELPNHLISESSIFARFLSGTELPHATILVTSRPSATYKLWENWKQHISRHIEILGFTEHNITEYSQSILSVNEQPKFQDYLSLHPYIRSMLYIPLHYAITIIIYLQCQQSDKIPPKTLTELYTCLTQTILIRYLNNHPEYKGKKITLNTLSNLPPPVYAHFLSLCNLAFDGINEQKQVFHSSPDPFEHLGFMDAISELFVHQQSASFSYNFLHLSVQEYLAAYHVSLMSHQEQKQLLQAVDYYDHRSNMIRFLAGITNFKDLDKAVVKKVTGIESMLSMYTLELLYECQDVSILDSEGETYEIYISTDSLHQLHSLGYCIANSKSKWNLKFKYKNKTGVDVICQSLKEVLHPDFTIESIKFGSCNPEFTFKFLEFILPILSRLPTIEIQSDSVNMEISFPTDSLGSFIGTPKLTSMLLPQQSQESIAHIGSLTVTSSCLLDVPQPLPPCLPELIPRMERLITLTLENVLDSSLTELIPVLSRVPTLRNLTLHKLNSKDIALLCQSLPTYQLEKLTLHEQTKPLKTHVTLNLCNNSIETIECQYCTAEFIDQILLQIPQQSIIPVQAFTLWNEIDHHQPLPACLLELVTRMERLNALTLKNVTSLTELVPVLSRVPTLRNLILHKLNSEDIALLCQLLPTYQLEKLTLHEQTKPLESYVTVNLCNNSIKAIECQYCTVEFTDHILSQIPQQSITHIQAFILWNKVDHHQPLPACLLELMTRMERLNMLTMMNVLDTSLTELIPVLSRVPTLRILTLSKLNSEGIYHLCQWLPTCLLEKLILYEQIETKKMTIDLCKNSNEAIECQDCTTNLINQILPHLPQQCLTHLKTLKICNDIHYHQLLPLCLPEVIRRMERLNTLTLENVLDNSLTELILALSRVPTLKKLTLSKLNSEGIALLSQWLPTCKLETLTLHEQTTETLLTNKMTIGFCNNSNEAIECQNCTPNFINQILPQLPQQCLTHVKTLKICNHHHHYQLLPPCLPEVILRMERLNTLTLENVLDTSLAKLILAQSRVPTLRNLRIQSNSGKLEMFFSTDSLPTGPINAYCTPKWIGMFLPQLPQQTIAHIGSLIVTSLHSQEEPQALPPCLPELIPRMKRLNTLTLNNVLDASLTELIPVLSRVPTLRNLTLPKLSSEGITLLCQWLPRYQLEKLTLYEQIETNKMMITFCNNAIEVIECQYCTKEFINQILALLSQQSITCVIICYGIGHYKPLPPCLPELIPRMERLNTLTLKNVLDTLLMELIPALSRVPTLRNLTLHKLNSEGIALLCQWLPTCQLETLTVHEQIEAYRDHKMTITFCNNSIEAIECQCCTIEFIDQILSQILQQPITHIQAFSLCNEVDHQPLPQCLPELIPRMERLNILTLKNVLDTSLTELIPVLSKVPTLRNLTLHQLNSEGITLLCQWLPTYQLETLTIHELIRTYRDHKITIAFCNNSIEVIECQYCTKVFINQILTLLSHQSITHVIIWNDINHCQPLPHCLPELIPRMEKLNVLTLKNVLDTSLTELIPALYRVPTLTNLTLHKLNPKSIVLLCQWLPTCQLETLTLHEQTETKITVNLCNSSIEAIECVCCTTEFIDQILPLLPQQCVTHVRTLTVCSELDRPQLLPPCLPELISRMKRLTTLTIIEALGTSLTELIPVLLRVPTLKNLTLSRLNSEGTTLLYQVQSALQLEELRLLDSKLYEKNEKWYYHEIALRNGRSKSICDSSIETIVCYNCTEEFIVHVQLQQLAIHAKSMEIEYYPIQSLPPCLIELIPRMERLNTLTLENVLDTSLTELMPVLSRVPSLRNLTLYKLHSEAGITLLCQWLPTLQLETLTIHEQIRAYKHHKMTIAFCNNFIEAIECQYCTKEFIDQILPLIPQQCVTHVRTLTVCSELDHPQPLPPCLPELISRMKRLTTLTIIEALDTSLTELIPVLLRVPTLKNLTLSRLNSEGTTLLYQVQLALQLEELRLLDSKLYEKNGKWYYHEIALRNGRSKSICDSSIETIVCYNCTEEFIVHVQLQQLAIHAKSMEIVYNPMESLPPCLIELIPRMERLNTLTLENVLDTSLTELMPVLSRVPSLRNLTLYKLNSEGITLLCQWLPRYRLEKLTLYEQIETNKNVMTITFCNNSIEVIECQYCTKEFNNQILTLLSQQSITCVIICNDIGHCISLPPCLSELMPRMERLNTLTLKNVLDTLLTDLIPALSKVPTLRNLTLHKLNLEGVALLCQWLPTCQLETLTVHEQIEAYRDHKMTITFCNNSIEAIECQCCTIEFIDQILSQILQQPITHIQAFTLCNEVDNQPLPQCLPELIPRMERLNTLTLINVLDTSLTELLPVLSKVPNLRNLTLHQLNSEGITLLCQWLPTCQLETLTIYEQIRAYSNHKMTIAFSNNSIEVIECQYCTKEFINQILTLLSHQSITHVEEYT